jgi:predicted DCC family thiol-disulfide oxidoreductase YuxK
MPDKAEHQNTPPLTVYYDGACPKCIRDRATYQKLSGTTDEQVCWFNITGQESQLRELGIDPQKALAELHVRDADGHISKVIFLPRFGFLRFYSA